MLKQDLITGLILAYLIAGFLIPTLHNTRLSEKIPPTQLYILLFAVLPILAVIGLWIASRFWNSEEHKIKATAALSLWFAVSWELAAYFGQF